MKICSYAGLDKEAQELIKSDMESVLTEKRIDWQKFEEVQLSDEKRGPPSYATNEILDALEERGAISLRDGYGAYALSAGNLINIGPKRNMFSKYHFSELEELQRYVKACYGYAEYPIIAVHSKSIITI